jgi:two-component system sensor histidine kinase KdpD
MVNRLAAHEIPDRPISHDMRTPIAAISASATSLVSLPAMLETTVKESLLNTIVEQCKRLNRYTSNLLELGRIQAGIDDLSLTSVDLLDILGTVIVRFRQNNPDFVINKLYDTGSILIRANEVMVEQVLENVLDNAIRYSAENKRIDVRVDACGRHARIAVQDHGVGISQQDLPRVFERFYRGSRTETLPGSGLGLAIVKGFVERFGGEIAVESPSAQGVGTRLSIKLPLFETAQA